MKKRNLLKPAVVTILMLILFSAFVPSTFASTPFWMEKGVYAEYSFTEGLVIMENTNLEFENGTFRWECVDLTGTTAKLSITLSVNREKSNTLYSAEALVETLNRSVYGLDGNQKGTTNFWLESNPVDEQEVILWNLSADKVVGELKYLDGFTMTPQGQQDSYEMDGNGTINENPTIFTGYYDMDTGVLTTCVALKDGLFSAMDLSLLTTLIIADTNIDLGPSLNVDLGPAEEPGILNFLIPLGFVGAFLVVFASVYKIREKSGKNKK